MVLGRVGSRGVWSVSCKMTWRLIHATLVLIANFKLIHYPQIRRLAFSPVPAAVDS